MLQRPPGKSCLAGPVCSARSPEEGGGREGEFLTEWLVWGHPSAPESGEGPVDTLGPSWARGCESEEKRRSGPQSKGPRAWEEGKLVVFPSRQLRARGEQ